MSCCFFCEINLNVGKNVEDFFEWFFDFGGGWDSGIVGWVIDG